MAADDHQSSLKHGKTTTTGAVSPNATKKPKERVPVKPELTEINQYLMCSLCSGYLIDATAIIECQHTFCKSCILKYLETNSYCPICDVQLNKAKPHMSLRSDVIVQRLVYKLVPGLLVSELRKRRDFGVSKCGVDGVEAAESASNGMTLEVEAATDLSTILSLEDVVSLSIEYFRSTDGEEIDPKQQFMHEKQDQQTTLNSNSVIQDIKGADSSEEANDRRYLQCPAAVSVGLLKKFIRMKYGLSDDYRVDLLYNGNRDNILENDLTLLDVAFIFKWNKDEPMRFQYRIFERTIKSLGSRAGTKRSAPSMMDDDDEPPDDDAPAGPQNRPPRTSTSPSSKFPRLSGNSTSTGANNNSGNTGKSSSRSTSSNLSVATPVYEFSESTEDYDFDIMRKTKPRGFHRSSDKVSQSSLKRSPNNLRSQASSRSHSIEDKAGSGKVDLGNVHMNRRSASTSTVSGKSSRGRSSSVGNSGGSNEIDSEEEEEEEESSSSDSREGVRSKNSDRSSGTTARLRSAAQQVMQSQINGSLKFSLSANSSGNNTGDEKREPLKLSLGSVMSKNLERRHHKHRHHKMKHKEKNKPVKLSINLNKPNQSMSQSHKLSGIGKEVKFTLGKSQQNTELASKGVDGKGNGNVSGGTNNLPTSVKTATSAHLSNISKSISVSIGGVNMQGSNNNNSGGNVTNIGGNQTLGKVNQSGQPNKILSPSELLPKNTGIEIQTTSISQVSQHNSNSSNATNNQTSCARTHPLLPESVHVPKSVTLIPVNPNSMNNNNSGSSSGSNRGNSSGGNPQEKSGPGTSNRFNPHTFTHPITNKSLHQITVTEVPPPSKSNSPANNTNNNSGGNGNSIGSTNVGTTSSNSIEKVIANAANKPQFSGPGSMEITKIYCGMKDNPTKKLKERKGLDISISVPGMNAGAKDKPKSTISTQKLEETLRQKIGMNNQVVNVGGTGGNNNKIKPVTQSQAPTTLLNARMPPGITIGPAGISKNTLGSGNIGNVSGIGNNPGNPVNTNGNTGNTTGGTNNNNTIKSLGFNLPPHITALPQLPPGGMKNPSTVHQNKPNEVSSSKPNPSNRPSHKESPGHQSNINQMKAPSPSPMESMMNGKPLSGSKNQMNRKHLGEALASMFEMASRNSRNVKSPSPPKNSHQNKEKVPSQFPSQSNRELSNSGACEKRIHTEAGQQSSRKSSSDSPEPKRPRGGGNNESLACKTSSSEAPLDLSGRSSRPGSASDFSNSNSSSPILGNVKTLHSEKSKTLSESSHHHSTNSNSSHAKQSSTSPNVPKISSTSHSHSTGKSLSSLPNHHHKSHQEISKKPLTNTLTPTTTSSASSILSIAQSLAQKQIAQQQQQNLHNQIMQLHQGLHNMQHSNQSLGNPHQGKPGSMGLKGIGSGSNGGNMGSNSMGLSSLSPPMIQMPNPSPPGSSFDPLRNLLTLSDAAVRQGKLHPMNNLMAAVGLCPPPPPPLNHGMSLASGSVSHTHGGIFSHFSPQLASSLAGVKSPTGILDPGSHAHLFGNLAALSAAHNERLAAAAGINHFGSSLSPPLSLANSFYSQVRPPSSSPHNVRIPHNVTPKSNSSNSNKKGSTPPLSFSHPPTVSSPRSPSHNNNSSTQAKLPTSSPVSILNSTATTAAAVVTSNIMGNSTHSKPSLESTNSMNSMKNIKINGTLSNPLPLLPPGIHNPLLPIYTRTQTSSNNNNNGNKGIGSNTTTSGSGGPTKVTYSDKKGIPNSMKISNFLPSKPKDGKVIDRNVEATITSGSNVGGSSLTKFLNSIPPLIVSQSQPNLSVSTPPKDSSRLLSTPNNKSDKECISLFPTSKTTVASCSDLKTQKILKIAPITTTAANLQANELSTSVMNSIKNEPTSPTSSSKMSSGLFSHNETCHPTPIASPSEDPTIQSKSTAHEIKSEQGELTATVKVTESSSTSGKLTPSTTVGILSLSSSVSPPSSSVRTTQPQNKAVRHIPNPSLLFNRQNSNTTTSSSNIASSLIVPSIVSETLAAKSILAQGIKIQSSLPLIKLEQHTLQVPIIPCPGVSIPIQIKVDNDSVPIPIPVEQDKNETLKDNEMPGKSCTETVLIAQVNKNEDKVIEMKLKEDDASNKLNKKKGGDQPIIALEKEVEPVKADSKEEIMKIEYNLDDADQDIDVGTEMTPLFTSTNEDKSQDCLEEKVTSIESPVQQNSGDKVEESFVINKIISKDTTRTIEDKKKDQNDTKENTSVLKEGSANEEKPFLDEVKPQQDIPLEETQMEIENVDESGKVNILEKTIQVESIKQQPMVGIDGTSAVEDDVDVGMDEPMEVNVEEALEPLDNELEENEKVQQDEDNNSLSRMEIEGENLEPEMEIVDTTSTTLVIDSLTAPTSDDISINLIQMECNESVEPNAKINEEMQNPDEKLCINLSLILTPKVPAVVLLPTPSVEIDSTMEKENIDQILLEAVSEDIEMKEEEEYTQKCENVVSSETPNTSEPVSTSTTTVISSSQSLEKVVGSQEDLTQIPNSNSNPFPNQITITSEALQVVDTTEEENKNTDSIHIEPSDEPVDLKENSDSINVITQSGIEMDKLMESSSSFSQLEIDSLSNSSSLSLLTQVVLDPSKDESEQKPEGVEEECKSETLVEKESSEILQVLNECPTPTPILSDDIISTKASEEEEKNKSQNIIKPEGDELNSISIPTKKEIPIETCANVFASDPVSNSIITIDTTITDTFPEFVKSQEKSSDKKENDDIFKPALISATITTATSTMAIPTTVTSNTLEINLGIPSSTIASSISKNSLEKSEVNLTPVDSSLEKVAAELIASAASSINNNNNTSLTIPPQSCDITITTTNANA